MARALLITASESLLERRRVFYVEEYFGAWILGVNPSCDGNEAKEGGLLG